MLTCSCCSELFNHGSPSPYLRVVQNEGLLGRFHCSLMAASACSNLKVMKAFEPDRSEKTAANDHPEFKDLTKTG